MGQKIVIHGRLPGLNEYTRACRSNYQEGAKLKAEAEDFICWQLKAQKLTPQKNPAILFLKWYEPNYKRDADNIAFAKKFIFDALVRMKYLIGDGRKQIPLYIDAFPTPDKNNPRIEIMLMDIGDNETVQSCMNEAIQLAKETITILDSKNKKTKTKGGNKNVNRSGCRVNQLPKTLNSPKQRGIVYSRIQKLG